MKSEFFDQIMQKLFKKDDKEIVSQPFVSEQLIRSESFTERYDEWKVKRKINRRIDALRIAMDDVNTSSGSHPYLVRYRTPEANGFALYAGFGFGDEEYSFLLDHFRDMTLTLGYRLYTSDRKHSEKGEIIERVDRHYLKPAPAKLAGETMNQIYGNILIELISRNDKPFLLKLMASVYAGRQYSQPLPFEQLIEALFAESGTS
jgi:hypothetical protein